MSDDDEFIIPAGSVYQVPPHLRDKLNEVWAAQAAADQAETETEYAAWTAEANELMHRYFLEAADYEFLAIEREKH
jgi:hypothetical protein